MDKQRILLATHNKNKVDEVKEIMGDDYEILTMEDIGITEEPIEDGKTIQDNARIKVNFVRENIENPETIIMADDTGLFVDALYGAPGVYSARFAGEECSYDDNNEKLLKMMSGVANRNANFKTAIALWFPDETEDEVTGTVNGRIALFPIGKSGFGYDPIFIETTTDKTYAEMGMNEKNRCSHRSKALRLAKERIEKWMEDEKNRTSE